MSKPNANLVVWNGVHCPGGKDPSLPHMSSKEQKAIIGQRKASVLVGNLLEPVMSR